MSIDDLLSITKEEIAEQIAERSKPITKNNGYLEGRGDCWDIMRDGARLLAEYREKQEKKRLKKKTGK